MRRLFIPVLACAAVFGTMQVCAQQPVPQDSVPLWPGGAPGAKNVVPPQKERDTTGPGDGLVAGWRVTRLSFVSEPTLTLYHPAADKGNGAAIVVFPGGGYTLLAWDLEGTEVCSWLNTLGVTCALVKYRVPNAGPFPLHTQDLADAQRSMRVVRAHAAEWHVDPKRVGVLGFSAGGHLAAVLSKQPGTLVSPAADSTDQLSARPDFALLIYPAYLLKENGSHAPVPNELAPEVQPSRQTPPTFLVQAEDDPLGVENALAYYEGLKQAKVPAEMHLYAAGGHGFGLRATALPATHWPHLAAQWFVTMGIVPASALIRATPENPARFPAENPARTLAPRATP